MAKKVHKENVEILNYEEYCVYDLLKSEGVSVRGQKSDEDPSLDYDLYASDGILSLGLTGKTLIEVKGQLSYSIIKKISAFHEIQAAEYNVVVVYFKSTVTNYPVLETNAQGKFLLYISYDELIAKYKKRKGKKKEEDNGSEDITLVIIGLVFAFQHRQLPMELDGQTTNENNDERAEQGTYLDTQPKLKANDVSQTSCHTC